MADLEAPECYFGYPSDQLDRILGPRREAFDRWAGGGITP